MGVLRAQQGIYYQSGIRPPGFYSLVLLSIQYNAHPNAASATLEGLWKLWNNLSNGMVQALRPTVVPAGNLGVLVGFGQAWFDTLNTDEADEIVSSKIVSSSEEW